MPLNKAAEGFAFRRGCFFAGCQRNSDALTLAAAAQADSASRFARHNAPFSETAGPIATGISGAAALRPAKNASRTIVIPSTTPPVHATGTSTVIPCLRRSFSRTNSTNATRSAAACCNTPIATASPASASLLMAGASARKIRARRAVAQVDQVFHGRRSPNLAHSFQNLRRLLAIIGMQRPAQAVHSDPVTGAFVSQPRTPAARAFTATIRCPADGIRAGSRNLQIPGPPRKAASSAMISSPTTSDRST